MHTSAPWKTSDLASTIASIVRKRSRWTGPTAVSTETRGCTQATRSAISPLPYVPISATKTSVPRESCSFTARDRPAWLFQLAGVASTVSCAAHRSRMCPFTVVLP